ncbi:MAG: hypothetical protein ACRYGC_08960 [Janthinobacterium lividum]
MSEAIDTRAANAAAAGAGFAGDGPAARPATTYGDQAPGARRLPYALSEGLERLAAPFRQPRREARVVSSFEFWPGWLFYIPVVAHWAALGVRHGGFSLPTAANPHVATGGLCGESKTSILDQSRGEARSLIAPYVTLVTGESDAVRARVAMRDGGLALPVVVKPDIGCNGTGVRLASDEAALDAALAVFPRGVALVLQELVPWDGEAGVFYQRRPDEARGRLTSITLKHAPSVEGDGASTLRALVLAHPRHGKVPGIYLPRLRARLDEVPAAGEVVRLVFAGNHCKGSEFRNGTGLATPALAERIDALMRSMPDFHFGRVDLRFRDLAGLRRGEVRVIEINGVGSEATHIWDPETSLRDAYATQFEHYRAAFEIGREMRRRGAKPSGLREMGRLWLVQRRLMGSYPMND